MIDLYHKLLHYMEEARALRAENEQLRQEMWKVHEDIRALMHDPKYAGQCAGLATARGMLRDGLETAGKPRNQSDDEAVIETIENAALAAEQKEGK